MCHVLSPREDILVMVCQQLKKTHKFPESALVTQALSEMQVLFQMSL